MAKLEFGLFDPLHGHEFSSTNPAEVYDEHIRHVQQAEQLGYKYYFIIEHQTASVSHMTAPTVYLTAVAQHTSSIRFGPMIFPLPFYHPIRLAQDVAMLDHLSRGRVDFGMGLGTSPHEFTRWAMQYSERRERSEEAMEVILKAWTEETVTHSGKYWEFDEALPQPRPYQQPHPPVWVGAHTAPSFDYAAKHNFHVAQNIDVDPVIAENFKYWRTAWQKQSHSGPMPRAFLTRAVHVAETDAKAREQAEPGLLVSLNAGSEKIRDSRIGFGRRDGYGRASELDRVFEGMSKSYDFWMDNGLAFVGSPDTVARQLEDSQKRLGYDTFCGNFHFGPMNGKLVEKSIELFAKEVAPHFE
jgi:alkanesulfonate monooxygenase SsuD/methylene tetrahydromethanopterin reductase-like flavin-dependent oxidoreductase (luciferase family)